MLPKKLYNFNVIFEGHPLAGLVEEITLPVLERQMEEYRGAAMLGPVSLDLGMAALRLDFTLAEHNAHILEAWGVTEASGTGLRFLGAAMADDSSASDAIEVSVRGRIQKFEPGTAKAGELTKPKVEMPLTYYRYSVNGNPLIEIDLVGGTEIVNGVNRSSQVLRALGLS
ncbi:phage major tail tube protein [Telmatospirillum sp. J64-1]|uniref:phage major tail tube protein n=1 Tax=Telmatospirillum sp. J64-1 TaxID=2502183 RepID=UPI00115F3D30|nr:phage major tail tube protein [Telmatospirillum sp. J64-1]